MRPKIKYAVIYRHREEYSVSVMCKFFGVSRSGYYAFLQRLGTPDRDADLAEAIRREQQRCRNTYGYRRIQLALAAKGIYRNPKTVLRVMINVFQILRDHTPCFGHVTGEPLYNLRWHNYISVSILIY